MVINKQLNNILSKISLYAILVSVISISVFYYISIEWSHLVVILVSLYLSHKKKVNINYISTFGVFYFLGLFATQRYDVDKIGEIMFYQFIPLLIILIFTFFTIKSKKLNKYAKHLSDKLLSFRLILKEKVYFKYKKLLKYHYIVFSLLFSYITIFLFQGFLGIYGGLIVLFIGFLVSYYMLNKTRQMQFIYISVALYTIIYNFTLTHGVSMLVENPTLYVKYYLPTIIIPFLLIYIYQPHYKK